MSPKKVCRTSEVASNPSNCVYATGVGCLFHLRCNRQINGVADLLTLTFSRVVDFDTVFFTNVDDDDKAETYVDHVMVQFDLVIDGDNPFVLTGYSGTSISFGANELFPLDDFSIGSITLAAVPLPAGGLLLFGRLGALALLRRRRAT